MRGGFLAGAVGGLAIALLVVGLVAAVPQTNPVAAPAATVSPSLSNAQSAAAGASQALAVPGAAGGQTTAGRAISAPIQRPDSLLAVIPGEGAASLVWTVSPLLLGLVVAALLYAAYSRRQDASD